MNTDQSENRKGGGGGGGALRLNLDLNLTSRLNRVNELFFFENTELPRPCIENVLSTEDQCTFRHVFHSTVMSPEFESQLRKEDSVFEKTAIIFLTFLHEGNESYSSMKMKHSILFKQ